jgi:hypothetical protein
MNILEFTCLREGFTPSQLGLPDSVLDCGGNQPIEGICIEVRQRKPRNRFVEPDLERARALNRAYYAARKANGATA